MFRPVNDGVIGVIPTTEKAQWTSCKVPLRLGATQKSEYAVIVFPLGTDSLRKLSIRNEQVMIYT